MSEASTLTPTDTTNEPRKRSRTFVSEAIKRGIVADVTSGLTYVQVGAKWDVHPNTVCNVMKGVAKGSAADDRLSPRKRRIDKAWDAVEAGLDAPENPYQRGNLGATVLKGLGELQSEGSVNVAVMIQSLQSLPPEMAAQYVTLEDTAVDVLPSPGDPASDTNPK